MGVAENIDAVRRFYGAGPADDDGGRAGLAVPGVVWHVPGSNRVSGRWVGAAEVFEQMPAAMQPLDRWEIDLVDVMANESMVVATVQVRASRGARHVDCAGAHAFRLDEQARIVEAWGFAADQAGLDALFGS